VSLDFIFGALADCSLDKNWTRTSYRENSLFLVIGSGSVCNKRCVWFRRCQATSPVAPNAESDPCTVKWCHVAKQHVYLLATVASGSLSSPRRGAGAGPGQEEELVWGERWMNQRVQLAELGAAEHAPSQPREL